MIPADRSRATYPHPLTEVRMCIANDMHRTSLPGGSEECAGIYTSPIRHGKRNSCYCTAELTGRSWIETAFRLSFSPRINLTMSCLKGLRLSRPS